MPSISTQTTTADKYEHTSEFVNDPTHKHALMDKVIEKPKGKMTHNCDEKVESEDWIVKDSAITNYEEESVGAKDFINRIYQDKGYIRFFESRLRWRRGNKAINWREYDNGPFINESLHKINNIYDKLGKRTWCKYGNKGVQKPAGVNVQCIFITKKGTQCNRSKCEESTMCTNHFKMSIYI
tara:strand:+ start:223 stop:768 length:546 start_codon:yes stop_codon:yes gene_type:complete